MMRSIAACLLLSAALAKAELVWEKPIQDFHRVPEDGHVEARYPFKNTGAEPVTIKRVITSCGCTSAKLSKNVFAPGESGEILVKFTFGSRRGPQQKGIEVIGQDKQEWHLGLRVYIHEPITVSPALVYWRIGDPAEAKTVKLTVPDGLKVDVKAVSSSDPKVSATVETIQPGKEYLVAIKPADTTAKLAAEMTVATDFPSDSPRSYRIFARIK